MDKILAGVRAFRERVFGGQRQFFEHLASKQQKPLALFITCSDSRIDPVLVTQTEPGDLFIVRNAGNIVPPYGANSGGETATIEYSIAVLGIRNIIICGHSQCGAIHAMIRGGALEELPAVRQWFSNAESTKRIVREKYMGLLADDALNMAAAEENVLVQMNNLTTHPYVASRLSTGDLHVYGWYYDIGAGVIRQYDQERREFLELGDQPLPVASMPLRAIGGAG